MDKLSRRDFLKAGVLGLAGTLGAAASVRMAGGVQPPPPADPHEGHEDHMGPHGMTMPNGEVDHERNGFNPDDILTDFDYGKISKLPNGQRLREYWVIALNKTIEVMPNIDFPAWMYAPADENWKNPRPRIPGPTFRATEGDRIRIHFFNGSDHPHTMHFHGIHPSEMDGVPPLNVQPGTDFTYEFDAFPFGLHLYHCHSFPLARHIAKGLYGAFIIDPKEGRPAVDHEFVMVMAGFDVDFDDVNDFYHVNGIPFHYQLHPIQIGLNKKVRIYLVNTLEFDLINSFHLHANFFHHYPTGTSLTPTEYTDTIIQGQAQRGILEFSYNYPGIYMFHAHVTEFAELGWAGHFEVVG